VTGCPKMSASVTSVPMLAAAPRGMTGGVAPDRTIGREQARAVSGRRSTRMCQVVTCRCSCQQSQVVGSSGKLSPAVQGCFKPRNDSTSWVWRVSQAAGSRASMRSVRVGPSCTRVGHDSSHSVSHSSARDSVRARPSLFERNVSQQNRE
jgi:hypothetical protein